MAKLWLARHAEARASDDVRLPGSDLPLTPRGRVQAEQLAERLATERPEAVYSSDALRARETAEAIAVDCGIRLLVQPELRELGFGAWAGRTYAEVVADDPTAAAYFRDPTGSAPPGGETVEAAASRVTAALDAIACAHPERGAAVVGHAGSLRLALARRLGMPLAQYWRLRLEPASVTLCDWSDAGLVLETLNDRAHLTARAEALV